MENLQVDLESTPAVLGVTDRHPRATNSVSDTLERIRKAIRIEKKDLFETEATVQGASRSFDQETPGSPFLNLLKQCAARQPRDRCSPRIPCSHLRKNTPRSDLGNSGSESDGLVFKIDARSTTEERGGPWSRTTPPPRAAGGAAAVAAGAGRGEAIDKAMP